MRVINVLYLFSVVDVLESPDMERVRKEKYQLVSCLIDISLIFSSIQTSFRAGKEGSRSKGSKRQGGKRERGKRERGKREKGQEGS